MLLERAIEGYWLARKRDLSPHTVADYKTTLDRFVKWIGPDRHVEGITTEDVHRFLNFLADECSLSAKTRLNAWTALSAFWTWAEPTLGIPHILRGHVQRPIARRPQIVPLKMDEVKAILEACDHASAWDRTWTKNIRSNRATAVRDRAIVLVLVDSGLRVSELCDLRMADYDQRHGKIIVRHGKGNKSRTVFLGDAARQAVWRYLAGRQDKLTPQSPVFAAGNGNPLDRHSVRHMLERAGQRANVDGVHPHRFRHTFAINFLRNGGNVLELRAILGHEKLDTIRIYAELADVDLERAARNASPADKWRL